MMPNGRPVPEGLEFLQLMWEQENDCERKTDEQLPEMGAKAPKCLIALGTALSLLDRLASCWWGCRGGDHRVEYLIGRSVSSARAAIRLLRFGFYDEALSLIRSVGEAANLLSLFSHDILLKDQWEALDDSARRSMFSPLKVRLKLEALSAPMPMDKETYRRLSEVSVHVTPNTKPQAHNPLGMPVIAAYFQEAGVLVTLNELSWAVAWVAASGANIIQPPNKKEAFVQALDSLEESIGRVDIIEIEDYWAAVRSLPQLQDIEARLRVQQATLRHELRRLSARDI